MLGSLFNKVPSLRFVTLFKKSIQHRCFPVKFAKLLRTTIFTEHFQWLLMIFQEICKFLEECFLYYLPARVFFLFFLTYQLKCLNLTPCITTTTTTTKKNVWKYHLIFFFWNFKIDIFVSDVLYKRSRTLVNLKVLNANLAGFSFSEISGLILSDFERNNYLMSHLKSSKVHSFLKEIECFCIIFLQNTPS